MNASIEKYLKLYNLLQLSGWMLALLSLPFSFFFSFYTILAFQVFSLLEIYHAYKKWNNSSPFLCFIQTVARLFILFFSIRIIFVTFLKPIPYFSEVVYVMFVSWCIAEIIRYRYYVTLSFKQKNKIITWLRYSVFIICYPIGLTCEFFVMYNVFKYNNIIALKILILVTAIAYFIFFPKLFKHLLKQRELKLHTAY